MPAICGIDWASEWHDICIADQDGGLLTERRFAHDEAGLQRADRAAARASRRARRDRAPDGLLSTGCSTPASACSRSIPTRSPPPASASAPPPARATASTRSCSASSPAPTLTASPRWCPTSDETDALRALVRAREDLVAHPRASRQPAARAARRVLARRPPHLRRLDSPIGARVPRALPGPGRHRRPRPQAPGRASSPATPTAADAPSTSCSTGCAAPRSPRSATCNAKRAAAPSPASSPR